MSDILYSLPSQKIISKEFRALWASYETQLRKKYTELEQVVLTDKRLKAELEVFISALVEQEFLKLLEASKSSSKFSRLFILEMMESVDVTKITYETLNKLREEKKK